MPQFVMALTHFLNKHAALQVLENSEGVQLIRWESSDV